MKVSFWNKRKSHLVKDMVKTLWRESFFYELHIVCQFTNIDITDWKSGEEHLVQCNVGLHNELDVRDWLHLQIKFDPSKTDEENLKTLECFDMIQERDPTNGDYHEVEKVLDEYQNCYIYFTNSTVTQWEPESARRIL